LPTLYYIPNKDTIAAENKILADDEVGWPELVAHRNQIDKELQKQSEARNPHLVQVWFTGKQELQYLVTQADSLHRCSYQCWWRNRRRKDGF